MAGKVKMVPDGWHSVTPFLCVHDAGRAIEFYRKAFGATELERMAEPGGKVNHVVLKIGDSIVRLSDDSSKHAAEWVAKGWSRSPQSLGGTPVISTFTSTTRMRCSNAQSRRARRRWNRGRQGVGRQDWRVDGSLGHIWMIATHKRDVPIEEVRKIRSKAGHA